MPATAAKSCRAGCRPPDFHWAPEAHARKVPAVRPQGLGRAAVTAAALAWAGARQLGAVAESGLQPTRRAALRSMSRRARYLILRTASSRDSQANWLASWAESVMPVLSDSA